MQYEHNMKAHVYIQSNINKHIKQLYLENKQLLCIQTDTNVIEARRFIKPFQIAVSRTTKYRHLKTSIYTDKLYYYKLTK